MLITLQKNCTDAQRDEVLRIIRERGLTALPVPGKNRTAICITGNPEALSTGSFQHLPGVLDAIRVTKPYKLVSREVHPEDTLVEVGDVVVGGDKIVIAAGPCSVESSERTLAIAHEVKSNGAQLFRGGAFKPRTSPYAFQGLGRSGLEILARVREETGLPVVSEVLDRETAELGARFLDILQIGARNMQNFALLKVVGQLGLPVLLKRGPAASLEEFLMAAEYLLAEGNGQIILCERGIRTFSTHSRNTLDLNLVPLIRSLSHLPILVDPSHGVGDRMRVRAMSRAAIASGAQGILVEAHTHPDTAYSDAAQTIDMEQLRGLNEDRKHLSGLKALTEDPLCKPSTE